MERPISSTVQKRVSNQNTKISEPKTQETSEPMTQEKESKLLTHVESDENAQVDTIGASHFTATANEDMTVHELSHLMQRPTLLESGSITADKSSTTFSYSRDTYNSIVSDFRTLPGFVTLVGFPSAIVQKNPVVASKIKQFAYFKGDMKVDIKINKAPQVSGCLIAVYIPRGGNESLDLSNLTTQGLTSLPYQILDYSTDTSLTMSVPYIDEVDYYNFQQNSVSGDYGYIGIFNLVPPQSGVSNASVSYSLFGSFQNIDLRLPTADTATRFVAQSGMVQRIPGDDIMSGVNEKPKLSLNYFKDRIDTSKVCYDSNETSLKYILSRENIIGKINYPKGVSNSYLGKIRCFPKRPVSTQKSPIENIKPNFAPIPQQLGTFDYTCNLFQRWTGTIEVGIRLIKTKFHYGRIAVVFDPFNTISDGGDLGSYLSTNYSAIIDLNAENGEEGGSNYYRFPIPYMNNVGFTSIGRDYGLATKFCTSANSSPFATPSPQAITSQMREVYNPHLRFYALTELGYLDVAADNVPILVSIRAGNDFQLSLPSVNVAVTYPAETPEDSNFYCQSGAIQLIPNDVSKSMINESTCNNETVTDLMSLTKRFTTIRTAVMRKQPVAIYSRQSGADAATELALSVDGKNYPGTVLGLVNKPDKTGAFKMSNVQAVQALFEFTYGGRRYKCMADENGSTIMARLIHRGAPSPSEASGLSRPVAYDADPLTSFPLTGTMVVNTGINNFIEIERNFSSNRKLINSGSDEVITQIVSYSPTQSESILDAAGLPQYHIAQVGPVIFKRQGDDDDSKYLKLGAIDFSAGDKGIYNSIAVSTPSVSAYNNFSNVALEEGNYFLTTGQLRVASVNNSAVLEAMPENAGFTFLKNPPCVQFL